jgi:hypothetical protein
LNQQREGNVAYQEVVLKPLNLLPAVPIHKETVRDVIFEHADGDGGADTERKTDDYQSRAIVGR